VAALRGELTQPFQSLPQHLHAQARWQLVPLGRTALAALPRAGVALRTETTPLAFACRGAWCAFAALAAWRLPAPLASGAARAVLGDLTPVLAQPFAQLLQTLLALLLLLLQTRFAALRQRALTALATLRHRHRTEPTHRQNRQQSHVRASLAALVTRARRRSPRTVADRAGRTPADQSIGIGRKSIASTEARW
jgi:hypothetical protein